MSSLPARNAGRKTLKRPGSRNAAAQGPPSVQDAYISTRRTRKAVPASARPSPESSRARLLASSSQSAPTMRCLRCGRTRHPWAARCSASATTSSCDGNSTTPPARGGRTPPTLAALAPDGLRAEPAARQRDRRTARPPHPATPGPRAPELRPDGRADVAPREHLTRHLCGLISRSGAGGVQEDPGTPSARADRYLIAEAAAHCRDQRLPEGMQVARQDAERNADAPPVVHRPTIATLRTAPAPITAAGPMPDLPDALDRIHRYSGTH